MENEQQIIDLLLLNNEEVERLKGALPAIKEELAATLAVRLKELSNAAHEQVKADVSLRQTILAKEVAGVAKDAAHENAERIKGELSAKTNLELEIITAGQRVKVAELGAKLGELDGALSKAATIQKDLETAAEKQFTALLAAHETKIAEIRPDIVALAKFVASQVTREYSQKHDIPALVKKEFAEGVGSALVSANKGNWNEAKSYSRGDIIAFRGSSYLVLRDTKRGEFPTVENQTNRNPLFQILAAAGSPGPSGRDGAGGAGGTEVTAASAAGAANRFWVSAGADRSATAVTAATARGHLNIASQAISALDIDWNLGPLHHKTLEASSEFTFSNDSDGERIAVALTNTVANYTVTWPVGVLWSGGVAPTQTVGAKTDIYTFMKFGSVVYGSVVQNF